MDFKKASLLLAQSLVFGLRLIRLGTSKLLLLELVFLIKNKPKIN